MIGNSRHFTEMVSLVVSNNKVLSGEGNWITYVYGDGSVKKRIKVGDDRRFCSFFNFFSH